MSKWLMFVLAIAFVMAVDVKKTCTTTAHAFDPIRGVIVPGSSTICRYHIEPARED